LLGGLPCQACALLTLGACIDGVVDAVAVLVWAALLWQRALEQHFGHRQLRAAIQPRAAWSPDIAFAEGCTNFENLWICFCAAFAALLKQDCLVALMD